jgi:uncharacterized protein (DUF58 family)
MVYAKVVNGYEAWINKLKFQGKGFTTELRPDKTYIFPTGFGFAFGILSFILLVMAIGYGNNILYFFVFFLVSMGLTTVWLTNKNVDSVRLTEIQMSYLYANEPNLITAQIDNANKKDSPVWDVEFRIEYKGATKKTQPELTMVNEVENTGFVSLSWMPAKRGYVRAPRILIQSRFPFKLLRSWKYSHRPNEYLVFPQRKGKESLRTLLGLQSQKDEMANLDNEGLFRDYREFQNSDSPARIDWKRSVKHQKHLVKNYEKSGDRKILIDWDMTASLGDFEERISQMALWVDLCHEQNETFSIKIKNFQTDYFASPNHYKNCMEKLALLTETDVL